MKSAREKYRELCKTEDSIPLFSKDWWLDTVCGEDKWNVAIVEKDNKIIAALPYFLKRKLGMRYIINPILTPRLGIWIDYPSNQNNNKKGSYEKKIINELIGQIPKFHWLCHSIEINLINWLPFYWHKFKQTTRYTYIINDLMNIDNIIQSFSYAKKKNIKKAEKIIQIKEGLDPNTFYNHHKNSLAVDNKKIFHDSTLFDDIYNSVKKRKCGEIFYATDFDNNIHAAFFIVWDSYFGYNLMSSIDKKFRRSGSTSLIIKYILTYLKTKVNNFDFEGSMIESVENSFRQFGARQIPYFQLSKVNSKLLKIILIFMGRI